MINYNSRRGNKSFLFNEFVDLHVGYNPNPNYSASFSVLKILYGFLVLKINLNEYFSTKNYFTKFSLLKVTLNDFFVLKVTLNFYINFLLYKNHIHHILSQRNKNISFHNINHVHTRF